MINPKKNIAPPSLHTVIKISDNTQGHRRKYNWDAMEVGSSFTIPVKDVSPRSVQGSIISTAKSHCLRRGLDWTFVTRAVYDKNSDISHIRIWRIS
jgi:hypothetical protein